MLRNGTPAPDFVLTDELGALTSLSDLRRAAPLVLLFFRFEECPTAQRDLQAYANVFSRLQSIGADLAAINVESPTVHLRMKDRLGLPFRLLSDPDFQVSEAYLVYRSDETEGPQPHGEPALFIIDIDGNIAYSQLQTGPKGIANPAEIALICLYMQQHGGRY